jgi:hypothetical protein
MLPMNTISVSAPLNTIVTRPYSPDSAALKQRARAILRTLAHCASYAILIIATTVDAQVSQRANTSAPMEAIFWQGAMTSARVDYEAKVVEMALQKTRAEYGDYTYEINTHPVTNVRLERDIIEARVVNIVSSPIWHTKESENSVLEAIPIPIAQGLLGYRQLVVRKADLKRFSQVKTLEDLRPLTAGVGNDWIDAAIFAHSNLKWFGGKTVEQLYSMLARGRLDYLPLSIIEVHKSLHESGVSDQLAVVPNLILYYPLPVFVQVSIAHPLLAERIERGLQIGADDGTLDALFREHYGSIVAELQSRDVRVLTLENPFLPRFMEAAGPVLIEEQ